MAVRILTYIGLIYQDLVKTKKLKRKAKLPPVFSMVFYTGDRQWRAPLNLKDCLHPAIPDGLMKYQPQIEYMLLDIGRISIADYAGMEHNLVLPLIEFEKSSQLTDVGLVVAKIAQKLKGNQFDGLRRDILSYLLKAGRITQRFPGVEISDLQGLQGMLSDRLDRRDEQLRQEGSRNKTIKLIQNYLTAKHYMIPSSIQSKFDTASEEELDQLFNTLISDKSEVIF